MASRLDVCPVTGREFEAIVDAFRHGPSPERWRELLSASANYQAAWMIAREEERRYAANVNRMIERGLLQAADSGE